MYLNLQHANTPAANRRRWRADTGRPRILRRKLFLSNTSLLCVCTVCFQGQVIWSRMKRKAAITGRGGGGGTGGGDGGASSSETFQQVGQCWILLRSHSITLSQGGGGGGFCSIMRRQLLDTRRRDRRGDVSEEFAAKDDVMWSSPDPDPPHTDTHRHTQTHTDTHRRTQTHTDAHRRTQTHTLLDLTAWHVKSRIFAFPRWNAL